MANLNPNKKPLPPAPGWGVPRRSWFWPLMYLSLIPMAIIWALINALNSPVSAAGFLLFGGGTWLLVWFVAVCVWMYRGMTIRPTRRPSILLPREEEPKKSMRKQKR